MKLLDIKKPNRNKVLTVRITESAHEQLEELQEFLGKKFKQKISQADLIERWIEAASEEMKASRRK